MCGNTKAREGKKTCADCVIMGYAYTRRFKERLKKENKCVACGRDKGDSEVVRCYECNEAQKEGNKKRRQERKLAA